MSGKGMNRLYSQSTLLQAKDIWESFNMEVIYKLKTCEFENWIDNECLKIRSKQGDALFPPKTI